MDKNQFIRARQKYWKAMLKEHHPNAQVLTIEQIPVETNFIVHAIAPRLAGVFEDDGETGYLYLYSWIEQTIVRYVHIYDRSEILTVCEDDVEVVWSEGAQKCGVLIWGKMRGIIDLASDREGRVWLESRNTPGIGDADWLEGFPK